MGAQPLRRQHGLKSVDVEFKPHGLACETCVGGVLPVHTPSEDRNRRALNQRLFSVVEDMPAVAHLQVEGRVLEAGRG